MERKKREARVHFVAQANEKAEYEAAAIAAHMDLSEWIRAACRAALAVHGRRERARHERVGGL
jgi:hypothetical protein